MIIGGQKKSFGSSASDNFNKIAKQKEEMAKKMKRGPYTHHAKPTPKTDDLPPESQDWIKKQLGGWGK